LTCRSLVDDSIPFSHDISLLILIPARFLPLNVRKMSRGMTGGRQRLQWSCLNNFVVFLVRFGRFRLGPIVLGFGQFQRRLGLCLPAGALAAT